MHDLPLINLIAAGFFAAWICGLITQRLGLSPIVGYLLAGIAIGPHTPGFTGDVHLAAQLAEIGVILLMFGVGLHFHPKDLMAVKGIAIPGAVGQSIVATAAAAGIFAVLGLGLTAGVVLGMAMAVASTVVLMRVLMDAGKLQSPEGHAAVGWLIVEDIFTVIVLVMLPVLAVQVNGDEAAAENGTHPLLALGLALLKLAAFVALVMVVGKRVVPWVMVQVARLRSRELFTLTVLVLSVAVAAGAYVLFGASMALGAFLAGMMVAQSPVSHQAAADALPLRDAFAVLFFVSVGMLFDPRFVVEQPLMVIAGVMVVLVAKPLAALAIVIVLGYPVRTALTVAVGLAQIGEFSFILSEVAKKSGLLTEDGHNVLVATAIISITLNPLLFRSLGRMERSLQGMPRLWKFLDAKAARRMKEINARAASQTAAAGTDDTSPQLAVVIGYGPVGKAVEEMLRDSGMRTVVVDTNADTVLALSREGRSAVYGDGTSMGVLEQARVDEASYVLVTLPHSAERSGVVAAARQLNKDARILVRARYLRERDELAHAGATAAIFEEGEAAVAMIKLVLSDTGTDEATSGRTVSRLRQQFRRNVVF